MNNSVAIYPPPMKESPSALQSLVFSITGVLVGIGALVVAILQLRRLYNRRKKITANEGTDTEGQENMANPAAIEMVWIKVGSLRQ